MYATAPRHSGRKLAGLLTLLFALSSCASLKRAPVALVETAAEVVVAPVRVAVDVVLDPIERAAELAKPVLLGGVN